MSAEPVGFLRKPQWVLWCEQVSRDVKSQATPFEARQLREPGNLIAWLRALNQIRADVQAQDADARLRLRPHAPMPGEQPLAHYLELKREYDNRHAGRIRVLRGCEARIGECEYLIERHGLARSTTVAGLFNVLAKVEELLHRDDIDGALGVARSALDRVEREEDR